MKFINNKRQNKILEAGIKLDMIFDGVTDDYIYFELIDALDTILESSLDSYHTGVFDTHLLNKDKRRNKKRGKCDE